MREWVITNGIGGFASSTDMGLNTRRYHGLLIAACNPPGLRKLILSKVDESIELNGKNIIFIQTLQVELQQKAINICKNLKKL